MSYLTSARSRIEDSILSLSHEDARSHLLRGDSYSSIGTPRPPHLKYDDLTDGLPPHFKFDALLGEIWSILRQFSAEELYKKCMIAKPGDEEGVNYLLFQNKDSKYAWRRFQLINPVLYVALAHHVTEESAWATIRNRFQEFSKGGKIECASLPLKLSDDSFSGSPPLYWWKRVEQKSMELSLRFEHILTADLANCYDSIYTHSIAWALHGKETAKKHRDPKKIQYIGNVIDWHLRAMNHGQTNGIPTGSVLMDLIAEMVLGYMDLELTEKLECRKDIREYYILRYRDDYRIFVNDLTTGAEIMKSLTEVAMALGFQLNASKTKASDNIIRASMKEDKIAWITRKNRQERGNKPRKLEHRQSQTEAMLLKDLLIIHDHSCQFPNAGSLIKALEQCHRQLKTEKGNIRSPAAGVLASVVVDIAYRNPLRWHPCVALLSELFSLPSWRQDERRSELWKHAQEKLQRLPNTEYLELWLQRFTVPQKLRANYQGEICQLVDHLIKKEAGPPPDIWNLSWVKRVDDNLARLEYSGIVDLDNLNKAGETIPIKEYKSYWEYY